jgi:hypothetical protein
MLDEDIALSKRLDCLRLKHQEIDDEIDELTRKPYYDQLYVARRKKERAQLRSNISDIEAQLYPDIIA